MISDLKTDIQRPNSKVNTNKQTIHNAFEFTGNILSMAKGANYVVWFRRCDGISAGRGISRARLRTFPCLGPGASSWRIV